MTAGGQALGVRFDPTLYLVTDTGLCGARGVVETVREAAAGGVTAVQVRDPNASTRTLYGMAVELLAALAGTGIPLLVNDRLDVAMAAGAAGVHLGQSDLPATRARQIAGPELLIGWSVSTEAELADATAYPPGTVDYLGVGPVFSTPTKPDAGPAIGVAGLRRLTAAATLPCVAIGGIGPGNAADVAGSGVAGLSVVSAICAASDPRAAAHQLREVVNR